MCLFSQITTAYALLYKKGGFWDNPFKISISLSFTCIIQYLNFVTLTSQHSGGAIQILNQIPIQPTKVYKEECYFYCTTSNKTITTQLKLLQCSKYTVYCKCCDLGAIHICRGTGKKAS